jgi:hypothetical protein
MSNDVQALPGPRQAFVAHGRRILLVALVSLLAAPQAASAGTVSAENGRLAFTATAGEANTVHVIPGDGVVVVTDAVALDAGPGCEAADPTTARCDAAGLEAATIGLGDGNDTVSAAELAVPLDLSGGPGGDTVDLRERSGGTCVALQRGEYFCRGGEKHDFVGPDVERLVFGDGPDAIVAGGRAEPPLEVHGSGGDDDLSVGGGHHRVFAGPGDDKVSSAGWNYGAPDDIRCGDGHDTAYPGWNDPIDDDCEKAVYLTFIGSELPADWTDRARREAPWYIIDDPINLIAHEVPPERRTTLPDGRTVEMSDDGRAVEVACSSACSMSARLTVTRAAARRLGLGRRTVLARAATTSAAPRVSRKLRYTRKARRALRRARRVNALLEVRTVDAAGVTKVYRQRVRVTRTGRLTSRRPG